MELHAAELHDHGGQRRRVGRQHVEQAVLGHGPNLGPFNEGHGLRLTRDPNTVFFFLDHLSGRPPFRLEDDTTWDTNLEQGIAWGLRLLEKRFSIGGRR